MDERPLIESSKSLDEFVFLNLFHVHPLAQTNSPVFTETRPACLETSTETKGARTATEGAGESILLSSWLAVVVEPDEDEEVAVDVVTDELEVEGLLFSMNGCWTVY